MHQQAPASAPHSNAVPQRTQAMRRSGKVDRFAVALIAALLGVIAGKINHAGMTALRQPCHGRGHGGRGDQSLLCAQPCD
jgi:hypothetical protein